jgi:aldose 1-epimerase
LPFHAAHADVSHTPYGVTAKGEAIDVYTLRNKRGVSINVLTYGGIITEMLIPDRDGVCTNVALTLPDLRAYENRANFSSLLGRYANRISGGGFTLDGTRYELKGGPDGITSHGGAGGYGARRWAAASFRRGGDSGVVLHDVSRDGDNGFPGSLSMDVRFTLTRDNVLRIEYTGTTDRPTVVNPSHHVYFNFAGGGTIFDHSIEVLADRYTPIDERKLPVGRIGAVDGTPLDLRQPVRLGDRMDVDHPQIQFGRGFDHNFVLNKPAAGALSLAARVRYPDNGRVLEVYTTEPGVQLYTASGFNGSLLDAQGRKLERGAGLALETQHYADSPNHPDFPTTVLRPGATVHSTTEYRFLVERPGGSLSALDCRKR